MKSMGGPQDKEGHGGGTWGGEGYSNLSLLHCVMVRTQ